MSFQAMTWACEQKTGSSTRKAVLLALANRTNHDTGLCEPRIAALARETELGQTAVKTALSALEEAGLITRKRLRKADGRRAGYEYQVLSQPETAGVPSPETRGDSQGQEQDLVQDQTLSTASRSRQPNVVWDALVAVTGFTPTTTSEKSDFAKTVRELRAVIPQDASDAHVLLAMQGRRRAWERAYGDARFTHRVLRGKWAELGALANGSGSRAGGGLPELKDGETF